MTIIAGRPATSPAAPVPATTPWPLSIREMAGPIVSACSKWSVPVRIFMGMFHNETGLGTFVETSSAGAIGPFQFEPSTAGSYDYPLTNTPNYGEFDKQAFAAAHLLHDDYEQLSHSWTNALAAYNAGSANVSAGLGYAAEALAFQIPANWQAALANPAGPITGTDINGPASAGGTAGSGGTGTSTNDTANFTVGDSTNPDEDYWTAINRLAQERYWYVFSDGETLYLADGPDLMKQQTAMELDRIVDAGVINHLDMTFDNTAWQYSVTHHQRRKTQRRTALAKVTSPVEVIVDVICKVDEVRAGDVVVLSNTGPGDGQWLAGDVTRSVFAVTSELTLVPALSPLSEGQLNPAGTNKNNPSPTSTPIGISGYTNPVGPGFIASRIDMGCDGHLAGNYVAPGRSKIVLVTNSQGSGSWEGYYIAGQLLDGQYKGKCWYVAEGISPLVQQDAVVGAGTPVARPGPTGFSEGPGGIETGWANPANPGNTLASSLPGFGSNPGIAPDQSSVAIACGSSFNRWMTKLGNTNPSVLQGQGLLVKPAKMPPGYP